MNVEYVVMTIFGGVMAMQWWQLRRYIVKVDDLENRVTKVETVMELLGDIRSEISKVRTDVEVIKSKMG